MKLYLCPAMHHVFSLVVGLNERKFAQSIHPILRSGIFRPRAQVKFTDELLKIFA